MKQSLQKLPLLVGLTILMSAATVQSKRVDSEKAEMLAQRFVELKRGSEPRAKANVRLKHAGVKRTQRTAGGGSGAQQHSPMPSQDDTLYYVFNMDETNGGGFVIIAADDVAMPVLGYSTNGVYDENNLPPNFEYWINYLSQQIIWAKEHGIAQSHATEQMWTGEFFTPTHIVGDTLKTKWNQNAPYNNFIPTTTTNPEPGYGGKNATGCGATAMAQIMKKYNHPAQGKGEKNGVNFDVSYDWANMNDEYANSTASTIQNNAVATLMHHIGASVDMDYGPQSGSILVNAMIALTQYFRYDDNIQYLKRESYYRESEWHTEIRMQLDNNMPVLYRGEGINGENGHTFVCDAYDKGSDFFHFNWGWGGYKNGWYLTTALDPEAEVGIFTNKQEIVTNIKPKLEDDLDERYILDVYQLWVGKTLPVVEMPQQIEVYPGERFFVDNIVVRNASWTKDFPVGRFGVALADDTNNIVSRIGDHGYFFVLPDGIIPHVTVTHNENGFDFEITWKMLKLPSSVTCNIPTSIIPGKYKLKIAYLPHNGNEDDWDVAHGGIDIIVKEPNITAKFTDPKFRTAVYDLIGKSNNGQIYAQDVERITSLDVRNMGIESLDGIEYFIALEVLNCDSNSLKSLNLSNNAKLKKLYCNYNDLNRLDVLKNPLEVLECQNNYINESRIFGFFEGCSLKFWPQRTDVTNHFIDENFRAAVREFFGKNPDEPLLLEDFAGNFYPDALSVRGRNIKSLAGIEYFGGFYSLDCSNNELTELDLSKFRLERLNCSNNKLTKLIPSYRLEELDCSNNLLTSLDVSHCNILTILNCQNNRLTELNISGTHVADLECSSNILDFLFLNGLSEDVLQTLRCHNNYLVNESSVVGFSVEWDNEDFQFWPQKTREEIAITTVTLESVTTASSAHLVTFVDESGDVIGRQLVQNGKSAFPPKLAREGYRLVWDEDYSSVTEEMTLTAQWVETYTTAIQTPNRVIPDVGLETDAVVVVAPSVVLQSEFTAGPNPVSKSAGEVGFFRQGKRISNCKLRIYDASGNYINKLKISDKSHSGQSKRRVGSWNLKNAKGRIVSDGTYLVKGTIKTVDGKTEKVSVVLGIR